MLQPGSGISPLPPDRPFRQSEPRSNFCFGQAREVTQQNDLRTAGVRLRQPPQRLIDGEYIIGLRVNRKFVRIELDTLAVAAALDTRLPPGLLDEDVPHCLSGRPEEMPPPFPSRITRPDETQIRLVDQRRRLQRVARRRLRHSGRRQAAKLGVHQRQQLLRRLLLPPSNAFQYLRDLIHGREIANETVAGCSPLWRTDQWRKPWVPTTVAHQ